MFFSWVFSGTVVFSPFRAGRPWPSSIDRSTGVVFSMYALLFVGLVYDARTIVFCVCVCVCF